MAPRGHSMKRPRGQPRKVPHVPGNYGGADAQCMRGQQCIHRADLDAARLQVRSNSARMHCRQFVEIQKWKVEQRPPYQDSLRLGGLGPGNHRLQLGGRDRRDQTLICSESVNSAGVLLPARALMHQRRNGVGVEHPIHRTRFLRAGRSAASARRSVHPG